MFKKKNQHDNLNDVENEDEDIIDDEVEDEPPKKKFNPRENAPEIEAFGEKKGLKNLLIIGGILLGVVAIIAVVMVCVNLLKSDTTTSNDTNVASNQKTTQKDNQGTNQAKPDETTTQNKQTNNTHNEKSTENKETLNEKTIKETRQKSGASAYTTFTGSDGKTYNIYTANVGRTITSAKFSINVQDSGYKLQVANGEQASSGTVYVYPHVTITNRASESINIDTDKFMLHDYKKNQFFTHYDYDAMYYLEKAMKSKTLAPNQNTSGLLFFNPAYQKEYSICYMEPDEQNNIYCVRLK